MTQKRANGSEIKELNSAELDAVSGGIIIVGGLAADWDGDWCGTGRPRFPIPPRPYQDLAGLTLVNQF